MKLVPDKPPAEVVHRVSVSGGTPEEEEFAAKLTELASLEVEIAGRELDLATVLVELHSFERRYIQVIGARYSRLDDLRALIAEARARQRQGDPG
ncbi:MAG: hypothetical protein FJZ01_14720, partial [Candidatus Sericytochromatia bacterium]|nr:hypothetical protein [Candidatus Tanganyikabacteria bacterium]